MTQRYLKKLALLALNKLFQLVLLRYEHSPVWLKYERSLRSLQHTPYLFTKLNSPKSCEENQRYNLILQAIHAVCLKMNPQLKLYTIAVIAGPSYIGMSELYLCGKVQLKASWQYNGEYITIRNSILLKTVRLVNFLLRWRGFCSLKEAWRTEW